MLDIKSDVFMDNNGNDTNHTRHWKCKMHKIYLCKGGLKLADIATKHVRENYLNPIMRYIMVRLDNI